VPTRILIAIDESPWSVAATSLAGWIADRSTAPLSLSLLHVVNVSHFRGKLLQDLSGLLGFEPVLVPAQVEEHYKRRGLSLLSRQRATLSGCGAEVATILAQGGVIERIAHHSAAADLLIMGAHGETQAAFPSRSTGGAERVVARSPISVLTVPRSLRQISAVAVGFDDTPGGRRALRRGASLAERCRVPLHVIAVEGRGVRPSEVLATARRTFRSDHPDPLHFVAATGEPREVLAAEASARACDVLAVGYRQRCARSDTALGRTTEWLIGRLGLGLLIAR